LVEALGTTADPRKLLLWGSHEAASETARTTGPRATPAACSAPGLGTDLDRLGGRQGLTLIGIEYADILREAGAGTDQSIELSLGLEHIETTQRGDDWLADSAVDSFVLDDLQVLIDAGRLGSDKHRPLLSFCHYKR
jgi:hypothetical protein